MEALNGQWQVERVYQPAMGADERASRMAQWRRAVGRSREWIAP
jgi:glycerol kinase